MAWARIDDAMPDHPKVLSAGALAELVEYRAICYANRYLTDGFIPFGALDRLIGGLERIFDGPHEELATRLVRAGLWKRVRGGWRIHDFLKYNLSRKEVEDSRTRNALRQQKFRERNAVTNGPVTLPRSHAPSHTPKTKDSKPEGSLVALSSNGNDPNDFQSALDRLKAKHREIAP